MNPLEKAINALQTLNVGGAAVASIVMSVRRKDGTETVVTVLDGTDAQLHANLDEAQEWLDAHPAEPGNVGEAPIETVS